MIRKIALPIVLAITTLSLTFFSCNSKSDTQDLIRNKDSLDMILDSYVEKGLDPVIYARLENLDGDVLYEHSAVNRNLIPRADINGQTWFLSLIHI